MSKPFISICIPAYKRVDYLRRLLDSIGLQDFRDFEVILTDDSPGTDVEKLCDVYRDQFPIHYNRNTVALGTPENWNEAIRRANGAWVKLVHDDDWFTGPGSLRAYHDAIQANPSTSFFFSGYVNVYFENNRSENVSIAPSRFRQLVRDPVTLFSSNVIGPPSVILHRNDRLNFYDNRLRWLVDIDFYIRYLKEVQPVYIPELLVKVGIGKEQVTQDCFRQRQVEIPEGFYLLNKTGTSHLKNLLVYDAWWRLMRNLEIRKKEDITGSGYDGAIPPVILSMISWQKGFPLAILKWGPVSKVLMGLHYIFNKKRIH